jgi:transmembrane sensor
MKQERSLFARVREQQDDELTRSDAMADARAQLFSRASRPSVEPRERSRQRGLHSAGWRARPFVGVAAAAAAAVLVAGGWLATRGRAVSFRIDGHDGRAGEWIAASGPAPETLAFSDGSNVAIEPQSRARVTDLSRDGARVVLERGSAHASFVHTGRASWHVLAGPMDVAVTGTRFDVAWDEGSERFSLALIDGSVEVRGAVLDQPLRVSTGQRLIVDVRTKRFVLATDASFRALDAASSAPDGSSASAPANALPITDATASARAAATEATPRPNSAPPLTPSPIDAGVASTTPLAAPVDDWRSLARKRAYREAWSAIDARGFASVLAGADADALAMLGDVARLAGQPARATEAFDALRARHPDDRRAADAAFMLGRIAFDARADYAGAARWFDRYAIEAPSGTYAREAAGRAIEAHKRAGDLAGARDRAQSYLARWPEGPHAALARTLIEPSGAR